MIPGVRILVVEDDAKIASFVTNGLRQSGFAVDLCSDGRAALDLTVGAPYDAAVIDVMLPNLDGLSLVRELRAGGNRVPVLFLSAKVSVDDRIRGLQAGGDDYMVKPFAVAELVARVQLRLQQAGRATNQTVLRCADLELDIHAHRVSRAGTVVELSPTEYKLLRYLLANSGRVLTRAQLLDHVWEYDFGGDSSVVDTYISYLRRKLDHVEPKLIHTIRGVGFCLRADG
jgi:two-component system OmpR family response regulator